MNSSITALVDRSDLFSSLRKSLALRESRESIIQAIRSAIQAIRSAGLDQISGIKMLRNISGMSLGEAKESVHYSRAWADRRESNEALHDAAFEAAEQLGFHEATN